MNIVFHEKHLENLGVELEKACARRLDTLNEIRRVCAQAEMTKCNKSIGSLGPLNKAEEADARLIRSLEGQIKDVKRQLDLSRAQSAAHLRSVASGQPGPEKTKWFLVVTPQGREVRHKHYSSAALQAELLPGYRVAAELYNADDSGNYGSPVAVGQRAAILQHCQEQSA
jgi:hypothetical protein